MGKLVQPRVDIVGTSQINLPGMELYLWRNGLQGFMKDYEDAITCGIHPAEALCSLAAKLCYAAVVPGKNANLTGVRDIAGNLKGVHKSSHGSVLEHGSVNFIFSDLSRIATHELVRHRVGASYSQTSGRYCRLDSIDLVWDPILDPVKELFVGTMAEIEKTVYLAECKLGLRKPNPINPDADAEECYRTFFTDATGMPTPNPDMMWVPDNSGDFSYKKKVTSAIRRIAPNGQANEIFVTLNFRSIRHLVQLRTQGAAEREIRVIFGEVYKQTKVLFPSLWFGAKEREVDGLLEVYGMRSNPYDIQAGDPAALEMWDTETLVKEVAKRSEAERIEDQKKWNETFNPNHGK